LQSDLVSLGCARTYQTGNLENANRNHRLEGIQAALEAFDECKSDGMIQVSTGGGSHATGNLGDSPLGAQILAEAAHHLSERYEQLVVLHTDHCVPAKVESFMDPLIAVSKSRVAAGQKPLFNSHMFDG